VALDHLNGIDLSDQQKIADLGNRLIEHHADVTVKAIQNALGTP
ncbi:MAG: hypothetical protein ACI92G_001813, partial [Candidatus Pelagisphaera sp.]